MTKLVKDILGYSAAVSLIITLIPQLYFTWKRKEWMTFPMFFRVTGSDMPTFFPLWDTSGRTPTYTCERTCPHKIGSESLYENDTLSEPECACPIEKCYNES